MDITSHSHLLEAPHAVKDVELLPALGEIHFPVNQVWISQMYEGQVLQDQSAEQERHRDLSETYSHTLSHTISHTLSLPSSLRQKQMPHLKYKATPLSLSINKYTGHASLIESHKHNPHHLP